MVSDLFIFFNILDFMTLILLDSVDWSDVYGSVPQSIISVEKDTISSLIQSKIELVIEILIIIDPSKWK
jgi:hypothetical protein